MTSELRLQRLRYSFGDLALYAQDVSQVAIVALGPKVGIALGVNQLHIDSHLIRRFLDATLKNVRYSKLPRDVAEIARLALILLGGNGRNDFQVCNASQPRQNFLLNAVREIGVIWIAAQIFKRQNGDSVCYRVTNQFSLPND